MERRILERFERDNTDLREIQVVVRSDIDKIQSQVNIVNDDCHKLSQSLDQHVLSVREKTEGIADKMIEVRVTVDAQGSQISAIEQKLTGIDEAINKPINDDVVVVSDRVKSAEQKDETAIKHLVATREEPVEPYFIAFNNQSDVRIMKFLEYADINNDASSSRWENKRIKLMEYINGEPLGWAQHAHMLTC